MNQGLALMLCEAAASREQMKDDDEAEFLVISLGWLNAETRRLTRAGDCGLGVWKAWKRVCDRLMPRRLAELSVHRRDLSLTTRSRCYTADEHGLFVPHGGNGGVRCEELSHYFSNTLRPHWPVTAPAKPQYVQWTLQKLAAKNGARTRQLQRLADDWLRHRAVCAQLAERPWLLEQAEKLLAKEDLAAKTLDRKRKYGEAGL